MFFVPRLTEPFINGPFRDVNLDSCVNVRAECREWCSGVPASYTILNLRVMGAGFKMCQASFSFTSNIGKIFSHELTSMSCFKLVGHHLGKQWLIAMIGWYFNIFEPCLIIPLTFNVILLMATRNPANSPVEVGS